jgi:CsoR family transcriptional regulator, copper-sensing transcriptional repressor
VVERSQVTVRGYSADKDALLKRMARVEGQVRGVARMVEEDRYCIEILTQIAAVKAAVEQVALGLVDAHVRNCMAAATDERDEKTAELMSAVGRLLKVG